MKNRLDRFNVLTRDDLKVWAGDEIISHGSVYQKDGRVSELAIADTGALIAFVQGTERFETAVEIDEYGVPLSICSCSYGIDCKHGVAVVLEYLEGVKEGRSFPDASEEHPLYSLLEDEGLVVEEWDFDDEGNWIGTREVGNTAPAKARSEITALLEGKSKKQLIDLFCELAARYPAIGQDLVDSNRIGSGEVKPLIKRLRKEISEIVREPDWQNDGEGEGFTPDWSGIRSRLDALVKAGHADEALDLGEELLSAGIQQVEETDDDGETEMEVSSCMPVLVRVLEHSSLPVEDKLARAVNTLLEDDYELCEAFDDYLLQEHDPAAWNALADLLLARLETMKSAINDGIFTHIYHRAKLIDWIIHSLEHSGRADEIIPLCESEAIEADDFERLVELLIARQLYEDAESWIHAGIRATENEWGGTARRLRDRFIQIRTRQEAWPVLAAIQVDEFVRHPSSLTFLACQKSARKVRAWRKVRERLLLHLESDELPWRQKDWPLPESGLEPPQAATSDSFPMYESLINIAIMEGDPEKVLYWYDRQPRQQRVFSYGVDEDRIADAVHKYAPDRAVEIWKDRAEQFIARINAGAYGQAASYLRKVAAVMIRENKQKEWEAYLLQLRGKHRRKRDLIEILDDMDGTPTEKKKG